MFENIFGRLRKRRRTEDGDDDETLPTTPASSSSAASHAFGGNGVRLGATTAATASGAGSRSGENPTAFWDNLFRNSVEATSNFCSNVTSGFQQHNNPPQYQQQQQPTAAQQYNQYYEQQQRQAAYEAASLELRPYDNDRFVTALDRLDAHVEQFRKDALGLQEKRDFLLMTIDLIKSDERMHSMRESERDEIGCYIQRINARLGTVELNVRTVRDSSQEDSLSQINGLIDMMITLGDPVMSRQRCQQYLNACCSTSESGTFQQVTEEYVFGVSNPGCSSGGSGSSGTGFEMDPGPIDKKFESTLLGCTLDDQKNIKKRLQALMDYLNKQIIRN